MFNNFPYYNVKSVRLGSNYITSRPDPSYILSGPITVTEGDSVTILLTSTDVDSGEVVPYIITGVTTDDISGASLSGEFVVGSLDSITLDVTEDVNLEGYETIVLTLVNGEDSIAITIDDGIISQIGQNILNLDSVAGDKKGMAVAINYDGSVVVTSSPYYGGGGLVRVYQLSNDNWTQIGQDIVGDLGDGDQVGRSIDVSDDGNIIAVSSNTNDSLYQNAGKVIIFRLVNDTWTQIGEDIYGEATGDKSGHMLSLNSDGTIVAISAPNNNSGGLDDSGHVRIYRNIDDNWIQLGQDIDGEISGGLLGLALSMNGGGTIVAIGSRSDETEFEDVGKVTVYQIVGGVWVKVGEDIYGENSGDEIGRGVSLNATGDIIAIGSHRNGDGGYRSGHVKVYQLNGSNWNQLGSNIVGEAAGDLSGYHVSLNDTGDIIAIGASRNDGGGSDSGHTRIYTYNGNEWDQFGYDVDGTVVYDWSGFSVDMSSDGTTFVVGEPNNDDIADKSGRVRVFGLKQENPDVVSIYNLTADSSVDEGQQITFSLSTENVDQGTYINYTVIGISSDDIDGSPLIGSFVVGVIDSVTFNVTDDLLFEGNETITLILDNGGDSIDVVINDGVVPIYQLSSDVTNVDEGQVLTISLLTENVNNGTVVPYTITGVTSDDIDGAPLTGNFVVSETEGFPYTFPVPLGTSGNTITFNITADTLTEGEETLTLTLDNNEDGIDIIINDTSLDPTYELSAPASVNEGDSVIINLVTENVVSGTSVPYTITGVTSDDIDGAPLTGNFVVSETEGFPYTFPVPLGTSGNTITFNITADTLTEGEETLTLTLDNNKDGIDIIINDTSVETYGLFAQTTVNEGDSIVISLITQGVVAGTSVPYTITGVTSDDIDGVPLTGNFVVGLVDSVTLNVTEDFITEGEETLTLTLDNNQANFDVIIVDTSRDPAYNLSGPSIVNEGEIITINLVTENVVVGTSIPYTITGVSSDDIEGASLTGNFVVGTVNSINFNVTEDFITEGEESLTLTLDNNQANIGVSIVDTSRDPVYNLSAPVSVNEGEIITINLLTENVVAGTVVPYTITGVASDDIDGASLTGSFVVGTVDSITINVTEDFITEGEETLTITLDNNEADVDVSIVDTSVETYELSGQTSANEGDSIIIDLTTQGVVAGTSVPYTITGVTSDDIDGALLTGNFVVGTVDSITINVTEDFITEGEETLTLTLDNGEDNIGVIINDTSLTPIYTLSSDVTNVDEGQVLTISLLTENVNNGTVVPYTITGVTSDDIDGASLTGSFVVSETGDFPYTFPVPLGTSGNIITLNVTEDFITEGEESLTLTLDNGEDDIDIIINDTSLDPTYELSAPASVNEGGAVIINLVTENVVSGTSIPYTITGVSSDDIDGSLLTGNFVVGTVDSITLNVTEDFITEGEESLTLTLDNGEDDIDIIINDTSLDPTYNLTSDPEPVIRGQSLNITLDTENVIDGDIVNFTITGDVVAADLGLSELTGTFIIINNSSQLSLNVSGDINVNKAFTLSLDNVGENVSVDITINLGDMFTYIFPINLA